jgi:hypothetical protein
VPGFFSGESAAWRVDFEKLLIAIKLRQANRDGALNHAERRAFIAQGHDAQLRVFGQPDEIASVKLHFEPAVLAGGDRVAFDERIIQLDAFPVFTSVSFQVCFARDQTDTHDARFYVVIIRLVVVGADRDGQGKESQQQEAGV